MRGGGWVGVCVCVSAGEPPLDEERRRWWGASGNGGRPSTTTAAQHEHTMLNEVLSHADIAEIVLDHLDFRSLVKVSEVSKVARTALDFGDLLQRKATRFVDGKAYVSTPTGWSNRVGKYTISRKNARGKTVAFANGKVRKKVRMRGGVEYVMLGRDYRSGCIYAKDLHSAAKDAEIDAENSYWALFK